MDPSSYYEEGQHDEALLDIKPSRSRDSGLGRGRISHRATEVLEEEDEEEDEQPRKRKRNRKVL